MSKVVLVVVLLVTVLGGSVALAQDDEFIFGIILVGPANDGGWSQAHVEGGRYVEANIPGTRMLLFESLNPADAPETSLRDVVAEMVNDGAQLIFTTSDAFEEDTTAIAPEFPDTILINISGDDVALGGTPPNLGNFTGQLLIPRMIAGCAAALTTQTGQLGMVAPLINSETRRDQASAYLGARYCWENFLGNDPADLSFTVDWIGFWFHIPGVTLDPAEEAQALIDGGVDVIINGIDTLEPLQVVERNFTEGNEVYFIGTDSHTVCGVANPAEVCLGSQYYNWGPEFVNQVQAAIDGTWEPTFKWLGPDWNDINNLDTTAVGFVFGEGISDENRARVEEFIDMLAEFSTDPANENRLPLWEGPLAYQDGTVLAEEGEFLSAFQLQEEGQSVWYLEQLLEGMTGASS